VAEKLGPIVLKLKDNWLAWAAALTLAVLGVLAILGYSLNWEWTGLVGIPEHSETRLGWDWLELLIVPAVLALGAYLFSRADRKSDREIAANRTQEELLQTYFDRMADLLLKEGLRTSETEWDAPVKDVARARTLAVLRQLDGERKGTLLRFLYEARLIGRYVTHDINEEVDWDYAPEDVRLNTVVRLVDADFTGANLQHMHLEVADLIRINFSGANFKGTRLRMADLMGANLTGAKGLTVEQLSMVRTLYKTQLDSRILEELKKDHPARLEALQEKPSWVHGPSAEWWRD
jgi:hypothetical protein